MTSTRPRTVVVVICVVICVAICVGGCACNPAALAHNIATQMIVLWLIVDGLS
jgi:hypothetical protein